MAVFTTGLGLSGPQASAIVIVASFYTTAARATGHSTRVAFIVFSMATAIAGIATLANGCLHRSEVA